MTVRADVFLSLFLGMMPLLATAEPNPPVLVWPAMNADAGAFPRLQVRVSSAASGEALQATFFGRLVESPEPDFTVVLLPDTQFYCAAMNGGRPEMFAAQTDWCATNRLAHHIAYVLQLGDLVNYGDTNAGSLNYQGEWENAANALYRLEDPVTTGLPDGIPYGAVVGNHDESPEGVSPPKGTTTCFNRLFGVSHFEGRSYYGGHYGTNNDNHYDLFSASGLEFVVVCLAYDTSANSAVLSWANQVLQTFSNRYAIVASHYLGSDSTPSTFSPQGTAIYNALKTNANLFLMLAGHVHAKGGEGSRTDVFNGRSVTTLISNYQSYPNGGSGYLRLLQFSPSNGVVQVRTYSPWLNQFLTDANSQFTLALPPPPLMVVPGTNFIAFGTNVALSGTTVSRTWPGLLADRTYEWCVTVADTANHTVTSPVWRFTTRAVPTGNLALQLEGDAYVDLGAAAACLTNLGDFTISGWFNLRTNRQAQYLFRFTSSESNTRRIQVIETNGVITADIRPVAGGSIYSISSGAFSYDKWLHLALVRQGSQLRLLFNGQEVGSQTVSTSPLVVNRWAFLGANTYNTSRGGFGNPDSFLLGKADEFQLWTIARTAGEIRNSMYQEQSSAPGLLGCWAFNEGSGVEALDAAGNNLTASVSSGRWVLSTWAGPFLHYSLQGTALRLSWEEAEACLESAPSATGAWSRVEGASSPFLTEPTSSPTRFFRLRRQN